MPSQFNTYLRGLLGLLDAKTGGISPSILGDQVQAHLDVLPFLIAQRRELVNGATAGIAGAGEGFNGDTTGNAIVPQGEIWLVTALAAVCTTVLGAAEEFSGAVALQSRSVGGVLRSVPLQDSSQIFLTGDLPTCGTELALVALPGEVLGVMVNRIVTAAALTFEINATIVRMPV